MSRKGKDLFELLSLRQRVSQGDPPPSRPVGEGVADGLRRARDAVFGAFGAASKGRRRGGRKGRARRGGRAREVPAWLPVIAVLVLVFAVGVVVGRWSIGEARSDTLRANGGSEPQEPGLLPRAPDDLSSVEEEVRTLSKYFFFLLHYPASQRQRASELAHYLRKHGVETARIKSWTADRSNPWVVLVYVERKEDAPSVLRRLGQVPPARFEPRLASVLQAELGLMEAE